MKTSVVIPNKRIAVDYDNEWEKFFALLKYRLLGYSVRWYGFAGDGRFEKTQRTLTVERKPWEDID